jgi:peptidoglycan hydrolase CwlO-like protein
MPRAAVAGAALLLALLVTAATASSPAGADPIADKRAEAAAIQRRIDGMNARIEALDEQYNQAQLRVQAATVAVGQAQSAVAASDQRLAKAKAGLSAQAVVAYMRGTPSAGGGGAGGPLSGLADLSVRKAYVTELASRSASAIEDLKVAQQDAGDARQRLLASQAAAKGAVGQVASARPQVE